MIPIQFYDRTELDFVKILHIVTKKDSIKCPSMNFDAKNANISSRV